MKNGFWSCTGSALHDNAELVRAGRHCWCGARELTATEREQLSAFLDGAEVDAQASAMPAQHASGSFAGLAA